LLDPLSELCSLTSQAVQLDRSLTADRGFDRPDSLVDLIEVCKCLVAERRDLRGAGSQNTLGLASEPRGRLVTRCCTYVIERRSSARLNKTSDSSKRSRACAQPDRAGM